MIIKIKKDISVKNIKRFHFNLMERIKNEDVVTLDLSEVRYLDLSVAQLIISLKKEFENNGKVLKLRVTENIYTQLYLAGYSG
jgi:anti-anti-sigma regulatory factor